MRVAFSEAAAAAVVARVWTFTMTEARSGVTFASPWPDVDSTGTVGEMTCWAGSNSAPMSNTLENASNRQAWLKILMTLRSEKGSD
ncbi:MAG: hypothetical protein ABJA80_02570 [bacterium]